MKSPRIMIYFLIILLVFQGISGVLGGIGLIMDPSGESLQIPDSWLEGSPFDTYFIPGIILFTVLGIFPLIIVFGIWTKKKWSIPGAWLVGLGLIIWIIVEIIIIGYHAEPPLQLIYGIVGILILLVLLSARNAIRSWM